MAQRWDPAVAIDRQILRLVLHAFLQVHRAE